MSRELDRKGKTALNETRLLILGVQVLIGFGFDAPFRTDSRIFQPHRSIWPACFL
jgi:hypothetical protein